MNVQNLTVRCCYTDDGATIQEIVRASFVAFLRQELETIEPVPRDREG